MVDNAGRTALPTGDASRTEFTFGEHRLRAEIRAGVPLFVTVDVCTVLDIGNPSDAMRLLDPDERGVVSIDTPNGLRVDANAVTESGLYSLILGSRKPQARPFKRWVTHEVLPAIRATGSYTVPTQRLPEVPKTYAAALRAHADEVEARERAEAKARELAPAAHAWTTLAAAEGDYLVGDAAKILSRDPNISIGQNNLFKLMASLRWVFKRSPRDAWHASQQHVALDRLAERAQTFVDPDGVRQTAVPQVRLTAKGIAFLHKHLGGSDPLDFSADTAQLELTSGGTG